MPLDEIKGIFHMKTVEQHLQQNIQDFGPPKAEITQAQKNARLESIRSYLSLSETGAELLNWADNNDIDIVMDTQMEPDFQGIYMTGTDTIVLSYHTDIPFAAIFLGHEIRHAWQDYEDIIPRTAVMPPAPFFWNMALMEADAAAHHTQIAAELAANGHPEAWSALVQEPSFRTCCENLHKALHEDFNNLDNGNTLYQAFLGWFRSEAQEDYKNRFADQYIYSNQRVFGIQQEEQKRETSIQRPPTKKKAKPPQNIHGINIFDKREIEKFGQTSLNGNYLSDRLPENYLDYPEFQNMITGLEKRDTIISLYQLYQEHYAESDLQHRQKSKTYRHNR